MIIAKLQNSHFHLFLQIHVLLQNYCKTEGRQSVHYKRFHMASFNKLRMQ